MGTPFNEIYPIFLSQITSYSLLEMLKKDDGEKMLNENLQSWLMRATTSFYICKKDLSDFDSQLEQFNVELEMTEKQILAHFMLLAYLNPYIIDENLLKQKLNSKDYRQYSEQGLLRAINETKKNLDEEAQKLLSRYSWNFKNLKGMFKNE